ncbi:MAG: hypothetical protein QGH74_04510 [Candidatus Brocadiia bacterium]|nr:hypothetical protein [Candidatus Brocadiia bacterium]
MEAFGAILGILVGLVILSALIGGMFMWVGAKMAGVRNATFGKSVVAAVAVAVITWLIAGVCSILPVIGTIFGFVLGLIFAVFVIQGVYGTSFARALVVWIFNVIAQVLALVIALVTFGAALFAAAP